MSNSHISETELLRLCLDQLRGMLPPVWNLTYDAQGLASNRARPDAIVELRSPDGTLATIAIEVKLRLEPREIPRVVSQLREHEARGTHQLIIASFLSDRAREMLASLGVSYADATGNIRVVLDRPTVFIRSVGAQKDPTREKRPLHSLKGRGSGRAVRAYIDFKPPFGTRHLAERSNTPAPSISRVGDLLEREALLIRESPRGRVIGVEWVGVLRRWVQDYSLMKSNRVKSYIEPRGLPALVDKLGQVQFRYAVTGSLASHDITRIVEPRAAVIYAASADAAADALRLSPVDSGANVLIAEPFDDVVFDRTTRRGGLVCAALSQVAADLLTGAGRNPSEGEALIEWMQLNEGDWHV